MMNEQDEKQEPIKEIDIKKDIKDEDVPEDDFEDIVVIHTDEFCTCTESATTR